MLKNMKKYDVIVAGGGLSGVAAAIAVAREGADVLIIEKNGYLGGMATAGLVNPFMPYTTRIDRRQRDWNNEANQGVFKRILIELDNLGGLHENRETFNEEILKLILDRLIRQYKIDILFHSFVSGVAKKEGTIKSVSITNKSGIEELEARYFVDATGDADVAALAGAEYKMGRSKDGKCQPMTLCFRLADVDMSKYNNNRKVINKKYVEMQSKGLIKNTRQNVLTFKHMADNVVHFNSTRIIGKSGVSAKELTEAEIEGREQMYELYHFLKENIEGFENCKLLMSASQIGVRESRRIVGEYLLTEKDLLSAVKFEDSIARGTYEIDIHNPDGSGTILMDIPFGDYYTIPYRSLLPKGFNNLIVVGRPISSTHEAHASYRIMPICTSIGEGAGAALSIAVREDISINKVDIKQIHNVLDKYGALY